MKRRKVFISYSHKDAKYRQELVDQLGVLERENLLEVWDDTEISAGDPWYEQINKAMLECRLAILMVSADFLQSPFIRTEEVPELIRCHEEDGMRLFPLLVRSCPWKSVPWLARLQMRPPQAKPLARRRPAQREEILTEVAYEVERLVLSQPARAAEPKRNARDKAGTKATEKAAPGAEQLPEYIYCGVEPPVGLEGTRALLAGEFQAIWFPRPRYGRRVEPEAGSHVWLVWRRDGQRPRLLGSGRIQATEEGSVSWTNRTLPGVRSAAQALGYGGPTNMSFLRLSDVHVWDDAPEVDLGDIRTGLSLANGGQVERLRELQRG